MQKQVRSSSLRRTFLATQVTTLFDVTIYLAINSIYTALILLDSTSPLA